MTNNHIKSRPTPVKMCVSEVKGQLSTGKFEEAEAALCLQLVKSPADSELFRLLSEVYSQAGRSDEASLCKRGVIPDATNERFFYPQPTSPAYPDNTTETCILEAWPAERKRLKPPNYLGKKGKFGPFRYSRTDSLGSRTSLTTNGKVWFDGFNTVVLDAEHRIVPLNNKGNETLARAAALHQDPIHLDGRVCFMDARSSPIYYHWMLDVLPKLAILEKSGISLDSVDTFLFRNLQSYQRETLLLAGIPQHKIKLSEGVYHSADELFVPYLKNDLGEKVYYGLGVGLASWIPGWLQQLHAATRRDCTGEAKKLFISRKDANTRSIQNESELTNLLEKYGFTTLIPGELKVCQQASQFENAEMVIGLHGAGLTNLAFCQPGTRVLELFGNYKVPCYWALANLAGLEYSNFVCEDRIAQHRGGDIVVDLKKFEQALRIFSR